MASYTLVQAIATNGAHMHMVGDGVGNLYVATYNTSGNKIKAYQYVIATDTLNDISAAVFGSHRVPEVRLAWFNSDLYLSVGEAAPTNEYSVYRWNGGTSWTRVDFVAAYNSLASCYPTLEADDDRIAYRVTQGPTTSDCIFRVSVDGTNWNTHTGPQTIPYGPYKSTGQDQLVCQFSNGSKDMSKYNSGLLWSNFQSASQYFAGEVDSDRQIFANVSSGVATLYWSDDWGATSTSTGTSYYLLGVGFGLYAQIYDLGFKGVGVGISDTVNKDDVSFWDDAAKDFTLDGTPAATQNVRPRPVVYGGYLYVLTDADGIYIRDDPLVTLEYSPSPTGGFLSRALDVGADDYYLYVATILGGNPVLLRLPADLSAFPSKMYEPGAGSDIGVECGDLNESWVWIFGDFGTPLLRLSIDDGATWTTKDPGTWAGVAYALVGSDDDNLVLVATDGDDDLHETEDGGLNWLTLNTGLPFDIGGMDRLDIDLDEIMIGNRAGAAANMEFSPSDGVEFYDVTGALPADPVTCVIVG